MPDDKLLPRNRTARLAQAQAAGNPVITELESGVGNCFPGLEVDLRNLERRFFPHLTVDFGGGRGIVVVEVALAAAEAELEPGALLDGLRIIDTDLANGVPWRVERLAGDFAGFGAQDWSLRDLGPDPALPPDAWTAIRLLRPRTSVDVTLVRDRVAVGVPSRMVLTGERRSYLTDDGAFAAMFEPGELTQSLCSPWTHDFRDCGCFYWASNHPDIAQPALPPGVAPDEPDWATRVGWLRADRLTDDPPGPGAENAPEMAHMEINARWQELDVVLDGREQRGVFAPTTVAAPPFEPARLEPTLRYAAGVELGIMLEYLAAIFSIDVNAGTPGSALRGDARAARSELLRVAISEMRHLRQVNDLLFDLQRQSGEAPPFRPALGVATLVPGGGGTPARPVRFRALTTETLIDFVRIEAPSLTVDGLYSRILATYVQLGSEPQAAVIRSVMADGADHYATILAIQEWLGRHPGMPYLRPLTTPAPTDPALASLNERYAGVLDLLHRGYQAGFPAGAANLAGARQVMLGANGLEGACEAVAQGGRLPVFATPPDPRFAPVPPP